MNSYDLSGRIALVTGGAKSLGLSIAMRMAASGATVVAWDLDESAIEQARTKLGPNGSAKRVDVTNAHEVEDGVDRIREEYGRLDILVNNAGITGPIAPVSDYAEADWDQVLKVNLTSQFLLLKSITPWMVEAGYGRVVNVASTAAKEGNPNASAYCAAKAGVMALTKSIGKELAKTGVIVNSICPAAVNSPMVEALPDDHAAMLLEKIPMGRFLEVEEAAAFVCWLSSEDCSFSTGAAFDISGGRATY